MTFSSQDDENVLYLQVPVLYTGPANDEVMLETLAAAKEPCVQELTDTSFEHLTQAQFQLGWQFGTSLLKMTTRPKQLKRAICHLHI